MALSAASIRWRSSFGIDRRSLTARLLSFKTQLTASLFKSDGIVPGYFSASFVDGFQLSRKRVFDEAAALEIEPEGFAHHFRAGAVLAGLNELHEGDELIG
jgi:hypothetical protein